MNDDCRTLVDWDESFHRMYECHGVKIEYQPWEFKKHNAELSGERSESDFNE